mmetsp:Transcript_14903/g.41190  ORF Transcript_14903/g.41190 Transcript_14903/m.41190 type:complete len:637 (-) Transcript_14903:55-1965(-)
MDTTSKGWNLHWTMGSAGIVGVTTVAAGLGLWYFNLGRKRLQKLKDRQPICMIRNPDAPHKLRLLELSEEFLKEHPDLKVMSMGQYLSQLQINILSNDISMEDVPDIIREQIDTALTAALISGLGPAFGTAVLPLLGFLPTEGAIFSMISAALISATMGSALTDHEQDSTDRGSFPLTVAMLGNGADIYATSDRHRMREPVDLNEPKPDSSLGKWNVGEVAYDPHFGMKFGEKAVAADDSQKDESKQLIPNPFIVSEHFDKAIEGMEENIRLARGEYNGASRSLGTPTLVNETLLPDLYAGWGDAQCTHTQREIVRNRLFCCLLNRLGHNFHISAQKLKGEDTNLQQFVVKMKPKDKDIIKPQDFVKALVDNGHKISTCPRGATTTFGASFCVKENDGSWTTIPTAFFLQSGYESAKGKPAHFFMPHSGLDMDITGPLVGPNPDGTAGRCNIQYYLAIEGMAGWHSNHNSDVPWIRPNDLQNPYKGSEMFRSVTFAAMAALTLNTIATDMSLPNGGYGLTGVCNDTCAVLEVAMCGTTNCHPISYSGRFLMHTSRYAVNLATALSKDRSFKSESEALKRLAWAMMKLPSDQSSTPSCGEDSVRRMLRMMAPCAHQMTVDAKSILEEVREEITTFSK